MDVFLRQLRALPWGRVRTFLSSPLAQRFAAGCVLGLLAACALIQWRAAWGSSGPFDRGMAFAVVLGLAIGGLCQRKFQAKWPVWLMLASSMSLIDSGWMNFVSGLVGLLPLDGELSSLMTEALAAGIALLSLGPAVMCWSGLLSAWYADDSGMPGDQSPTTISTGFGIAAGMMFAAFFGGPAWGLEVTAIFGAACGLAMGIHATWRPVDSTIIKQDSQHHSDSLHPVDALLATAACMFCGGAMAIGHGLLRDLMPQTAALELSHVAMVVLGIACGLGLAARSGRIRNTAPWWLIALAFSGLLSGFLFETGLRVRLFSAAYITYANLHQLAQVALVLAACVPPAMVAGIILGAGRKTALIACLMAMCLGAATGCELFLLQPVQWVIAGTAFGLCMVAAAMMWRAGGFLATRWQSARLAGAIFGGLILMWMQPRIDPARPAKLLFSTQTFLGYRAGWTVDQLPYLDDSRVISQQSGRQGTLTLWKSRGRDLLLREAGIPRYAISARTDVTPQPSGEVLQTVFPLLVAQDARNVLLLGASGGMPLSVCLEFPVERVVCVEPDAARSAMIRGPVAAERNYDPFADERVVLDSRPVELAARMPDGGYDIILSSPPLSSLSAGAPQFTEEFYRSVSGKLSEHGLFCQRWEGVDYGPAPLQLVAGSLTRVFTQVVAVEIGVGEYLFLATNSEDSLAPVDLPNRLETLHVRRLLARSGWDWSTLLTLPAWDHAALVEFAADGMSSRNTAANCRLAFVGPKDVLRWAPKLQETQQLLTKERAAAPELAAADEKPQSRRSRYLDWLGERVVSQDVLRRLSEVAAQVKLVSNGPDTCWLDYRKALRDELQQRPRTEIRQVAATDETQRVLHQEDERRKQYFVDLGLAGNLDQRRLEKVYDLQRYFEPYDPLVTLFARQEMAELLKHYGHPDPATELSLRLNVIHFAPATDRSLQNVLSAAELVLESPDALPDSQLRFDTLNGLLQVLRTRWEMRSVSQVKSVRLAIQDVDRTLIIIESMLAELDKLAADSTVAADNWPIRRDVLERLLLRPLRGYRAELAPIHQQNKLNTEATLLEAKLKRKR